MKQTEEETEYKFTLAPAGIPPDKAIDIWPFTFATDASRNRSRAEP